ncbi:hypothetical protein M3672_07500 [Microbacterium enclense]|uniref:hypothetical protein n=1 Tax=Microbacterium enclense TaxID=993073 RepID=UPI00203AA2D9|nr:hypothetical protein [Microbacterium enclense]MCM3614286.1 hypothetical protein [Microbacterium enclense]
MKQRFLVVVLSAIVVGTTGCSIGQPSYAVVREEALGSLDRVVAVIPDPKEVAPLPEGDPYPCDDPLLPATGEGAFFTGHWLVHVPEGFDIDAFVDTLPELLGEDWEERDPGFEVSFANVDVLYKPLGLTVSVEDARADGPPALELLVLSRCGTLSDDDRSPSPGLSRSLDLPHEGD